VPFRAEDYDLFVFDCDGVILDSNGVKSQAIFEAAKPHGEENAKRLLAYHQQHGGISRYAKFAYFVAEILETPTERREALEKEMVDACARICRAELQTCALIPGVRAFLSSLPERIHSYVVSGGAQSEVRDALSQRDLDRYFDLVLGSPRSKADNMQDLDSAGHLRGRGAYFGDARLDMELAHRFGLDFYFVSGASEWANAGDECHDPHVCDFDDLVALD